MTLKYMELDAVLKLCITQYFVKVKADVLLSNFYEVY